MTRRLGIDTSVLVRLMTNEPVAAHEHCVRELTALANDGVEVVASNQAIGEAFISVQHHYGSSREAARRSLLDVLESGLVSPLNGDAVLEELRASGGAGLFDRLIADGYRREGLETLTLDRRMARLPQARLL